MVSTLNEVDFDIDSEQYSLYDKTDIFITDFFSDAKQMLKQWKKQMQPGLFQGFS